MRVSSRSFAVAQLSSGKMAWGDKIVVAIAVLCFVLIVIALALTYTAIRATITL
jgi:hypothetical protein